MVIPETFSRRGEQSIVTYDFADIADGTGVVQLDGYGATITGGTETRHLSNNPLGSDPVGNLIQTQGNTATSTMNFDLSAFNTPKRIEGTANLTITHTATASTATTQNTLTISIVKLVGAVETVIGTVTSESLSVSSSSAVATRIMYIDITKTNFSIGDVLRVKVAMSYSGGAGNNYNGFYHDPLNRDGTGSYAVTAADNKTAFIINIPFRIFL